MAEAQQEVKFSFPIAKELIRLWKKRIGRLKNTMRNSTYPVSLKSLWILIAITVVLHFSGNKMPFDLVNHILLWLPGYTIWWHSIACSLTSLLLWLCLCYSIRHSIKFLLMYKGWMHESREKGERISKSTRVWGVAIKFFIGWNMPGLYSFQGLLPRLPLPCLHETMTRYLASVCPLLDDKSFDRMQEMAKEFEHGVGSKLQWYLTLKSWWSSNYVSDWWEEYVYLRGRSALMINSNYYGTETLSLIKTNRQSARAAFWVHLYLRARRSIQNQELLPIMVQGLVPLCSWQYERFFNTTRVPGIETDRIVHYTDSNHIVVMHHGRYFKVLIYCEGRILKPCEIQIQLEEILASKSVPLPGEELLASLTAWNRTKWAEARNTLFNKGINRDSLHTIETAAFILSLDDEAYETDICNGADIDHYCKSLLHGNGHNRWFDKSFTLCVGTNGRVGLSAEHAWGDAAVTAHISEKNIVDEVTENPYDENGNCNGTPELQTLSPQKMIWDLNNEACLKTINEAHKDAQISLNDLQLRIYVHDDYGKSFMKTCRMSPDAYIQMALQLAFYRDVGYFSLTYEASITRLFREGRTETVRSCTIESAAWVKGMEDGQSTNKQRIALLQKACERHQRGYQDAMCGKGIDRHLFCLYVVSKYLEIDAPFLNKVLSEPWRLTTSQTPCGQTNKTDLHEYPVIFGGGGFGPAADDGYAVSYIMANDNNLIIFHISSKASCPTTNSIRFGKQIKQALADMKNLFEHV